MRLESGSSAPRETARGKTVAIVGARGIGRHHAKWWHLEGAQITAFLCRSQDTLPLARQGLDDQFHSNARGYTSMKHMLTTERPDIVDVCSPNAYHYRHVMTALRFRCEVVCEKPFVYNSFLTPTEMLTETRKAVDFAASIKVNLSLCSQYAVAARICGSLFTRLRPGQYLERIETVLASPVKEGQSDPLELWVDLGPHALAVASQLLPGCLPELVVNNRVFDDQKATCGCVVSMPGKAPVECVFNVSRTVGNPKNIRQIILNDMVFDIHGDNDSEGVFRARIITEEGSFLFEDMLQLLIRETAAGTPPISGQAIVENMEALFRLGGMV
ncbi:MAG: Gfo/Idh/MocA family oxidoreductase [Lentisphaeria bacterium]|nr:Gfo/Idh/MocA family oxidoreductase [Lentisphaeria bacterium]